MNNNFISTEKLHKLYLTCNGGANTDTRKINANCLFFALKGENFNANTFAEKAIEMGAKYAIVDEEKYANNETIFLVENVLKALQQLANFHRKQFIIPILGITGSNGKTTNKELIHAVLQKKYNTLATIGNLNNHIGVPLTLLRLNSTFEFAIIEMGANHQGEIAELSEIAEPTFGYITNIGKAHLDGFGGEEGVKKGKSELYKFIEKNNGSIFINADDNVLNELALKNNKITFGCNKLYDCIGKDITVTDTVSLKFTSRYGEKDWSKLPNINTQIVGRYNFVNCLAAACVGQYFKVDDNLIKEALENYLSDNNRSQLVKTERNTILLDAYNANPNSMKAAIENFANYNAENKLVLLGDMFELGEYAEAEHELLVKTLVEKKLLNSILVGKEFTKLNQTHFKTFETTEQAYSYIKQQAVNNTTILIKGSRSMKMETLKELF